ncbi:G-protein coupled receptor 143-like isoform X2 [Emydura macquarii macquarii]|uniref:G-protein coupled receptor 143-like isoform X2 n=1 Tax=Emydura macquarii macquarii TaxID=1129001 RepID=UPI003529DC9B
MASPQLLRFCCLPGSPAAELVRHFHPQLWNGLCLGSAGLGLAGLLLQALARGCRGRGRLAGPGSERRFCPARGLGAVLAASCWLGTAGILGRSVLWLTASPGSAGQPPANGTAAFAGPLCIAAVTWVQYFYTAHFWALFCYALEAVRLLRRPAGCRSLAPYYLLCWGVSSTQCLWGIQQLLSPARDSCAAWHPLTVCHYVAAYVPLALVLLVNPLLLSRALRAAVLLRRQTGMYTARERLQEWQLRRRFTSITVTFTACWLANVVNDGLLFLVELEPAWHTGTPRLAHVAILTSWIIVAILNPVSGFLLSLAFLGWQSAWQPAGRALCGDGESSSEDSDKGTPPAPVVGLVAGPGQLRAPNPHSTRDSRAPRGELGQTSPAPEGSVGHGCGRAAGSTHGSASQPPAPGSAELWRALPAEGTSGTGKAGLLRSVPLTRSGLGLQRGLSLPPPPVTPPPKMPCWRGGSGAACHAGQGGVGGKRAQPWTRGRGGRCPGA